MRQIFFLMLLFSCAKAIGQDARMTPPLASATETMVITSYSSRTVAEQVEGWEKLKNSSPQNAKAWFNYYLWTERDKQLDEKQKSSLLTAAVTDASQHISQSPEYALMIYLQSGKKDSASLYKALTIANDKTWVYPYVIQFSVIHNDKVALQKYCRELEEKSTLNGYIYNYNYNVLRSADSNATIYGRGLAELVPLSILQYVYNIRKDIRLRYYNGERPKESNAYLCITLGKEVLSQYPNASYTGLLVKTGSSTGINELKNHVENDMEFLYIDKTAFWPTDIAQLYKNYLPSFILLYRYYKQTNDSELALITRYIKKIASQAGIDNEVNQLLEK